MLKKMTKILALVSAFALLLTGCSLIKVDEEMDRAEVVAEFTGGTIQKGEAMDEYGKIKEYYAANYGIYDETQLEPLKGEVLTYLATERIEKLKAESLGFTTVTPEEEAAKKQEAQTQYNAMLDSYKVFFAQEGKSDEDVIAETQSFMAGQGYTYEGLESQLLGSIWRDRLFESVTKDVTATEDQLKAKYDERVASDESSYTADKMSFEYAMANGDVVAWIPEGYRTVKHILVKLSDEEIDELSGLQSQIEDVQTELDAIAEEEAAAAEETPSPDASDVPAAEDGGTEDGAAIDTGVDPDVQENAVPETDGKSKDELLAEKADLEQQISDLKAKFAVQLQPKVDEIMARISAGEDFEKLVEEVGEDPGMLTEPGKTQGYYVTADSELWDPEFTQTAMAIPAIGSIGVSGVANNGIHIIRYMTDVTPGAVPYETLKSAIEETALTDAKNAYYDEQKAEWVTQANLKTYPDRMK